MTDARLNMTIADLMALASTDGIEEFSSLIDFFKDQDDATEFEKSFLRLAQLFHVAAIEGVNRERFEHGASAHEATCIAVDAAALAIAALAIQTYSNDGLGKVRKTFVAAFDRAFKRSVALADQGRPQP